jgi:hypothetical protein
MIDDGHLKLGITPAGVREVMTMIGFPASYEEMVNSLSGYKRDPESWIAKLYPTWLTGYDLAQAIREWLQDEKKTKLSMCEVLQEMNSSHVGEADLFYSHLQSQLPQMLHLTLLESLRHFGLSEDSFVWVDFFDLRQCQDDFNLALIEKYIGSIGTTICEIDSGRNYFRRTFCLFEVYATVRQKGRLLPFVGTKIFSSMEADELLSRVDSASAKARRKRDKEQIDNFILNLGGFKEFDQVVRDALQNNIKIQN